MKTIILIFLAWIVAAIGTRGDDEIITPNPRVQVGMLVEHNPVRPNAVVEGKVRLFAKEPYEAFSIYLSFSCVESFTIKTKLDDNAFLADDLQTPLSLLKNYSAVATDEDFDQTNRILSSPTGKWISVREQRILFDTGVYLEINRTEPLYGEHIFPFFLVLPDTNFPPEEKISMDYVDQLHEIKMFSYNIHYGYKVQIRNSTASPVGLAVQTDFTPTVLSPRPSSSAPLTITHTYTCRLPHCTGQYTSTKMLATLPMGDTYALGDTIPLTLYFTSDTPEPTDTIFYLVATVSGHFTALPVHPNRPLSWSSSHQFPIRSFFHEDPMTLDITFDKPLELSVPLSALKLPSFRARHSVYNYTLDLQLMAKNFWSPQTAQDVFTFKIPITIVSAWSSLPSPKSYDGGQSVATPYFANRSVKQLTAHERDLGARREKDVFIVKERLEVGRHGSKWLPEDLPFGCCWQWLSKTRDVYTPTGCNSFTPFGCTIY